MITDICNWKMIANYRLIENIVLLRGQGCFMNYLDSLKEREQILYEQCVNCHDRNGFCVMKDTESSCYVSEELRNNSILISEVKSRNFTRNVG